MQSLEERGISGDPEIGEEELRKRQQEKRKKRARRGQKTGPNEEVVERPGQAWDARFGFAAA